ncbi:MAG: 3D domain-containing protein [Candidatus Moraniibacteriota bacterium]
MRFTKQLVFVGILSLSLLPKLLYAATPEVTEEYNYANDPFLVKWALQDPQSEPVKTEDDKVLDVWKQKQKDLWTRLPDGKFELNASAYTAAADECGKSDGITASGLRVTEKRTLACPKNFPFGTIIRIDGMGEYRCEDRGGAITTNRIDIYMETKSEAFAFGRQQLIAEVVK